MKTNIIRKALKLQEEGKSSIAIDLLGFYLDDYPEDRKAVALLGILLVEEEEFERAKPYLEKAIKLQTQSELVYLSMYIACVKLDDYDDAITTMISFLDKSPAKLFRDTLNELLVDLDNGYATKYKKEILYYARKNNIFAAN